MSKRQSTGLDPAQNLYVCKGWPDQDREPCGWKHWGVHSVLPDYRCPHCGGEIDVRISEEAVCDFCSKPDPAWAWDALPFAAAHLPRQVASVQESEYRMSGGWAACDECNALILQSDQKALIAKSNAQFMERIKGESIPRDVIDNVKISHAEIHRLFFAHTPYGPIPASLYLHMLAMSNDEQKAELEKVEPDYLAAERACMLPEQRPFIERHEIPPGAAPGTRFVKEKTGKSKFEYRIGLHSPESVSEDVLQRATTGELSAYRNTLRRHVHRDEPLPMPVGDPSSSQPRNNQPWSEALRLRTQLSDWWLTEEGLRFGQGLQMQVETKVGGRYLIKPGNDTWLPQHEGQRLKHAPPYWVSNDMQTLCEHAAQSFPEGTSLRAADLLTETGFVVFDRSVYSLDIGSRWIGTRAVSWGPVTDPKGPGLMFCFYSDKHDENDAARYALYRLRTLGNWPDFILNHFLVWRFGEPCARQRFLTSEHISESNFELVRFIHAFLMMCHQPVTFKEHRQAERPVRRQLARRDLPIPRILVITLRPRKAHSTMDGDDGEGPPPGREYSHRFDVTGHWRPGQHTKDGHIPWVPGYVKGPEDKPYVPKERTYKWTR